MTGENSWADLYWIPVGAGTRFQAASLRLYEGLAAATSRRPRCTLVHAGLAGSNRGTPFTLELMPADRDAARLGRVTGPVGARWAGKLRLFRYQVLLSEHPGLPDQQFAVAAPIRLTRDPAVVDRICELSRSVPAYTWGRRRKGHPEIWTSDSTVSWILQRAGIAAAELDVPDLCRAPGWRAGLAEARLPHQGTRSNAGQVTEPPSEDPQ